MKSWWRPPEKRQRHLPVERLVTYYGRDLRGVHLPFNFSLLNASWHADTIAKLIQEYEAALRLANACAIRQSHLILNASNELRDAARADVAPGSPVIPRDELSSRRRDVA